MRCWLIAVIVALAVCLNDADAQGTLGASDHDRGSQQVTARQTSIGTGFIVGRVIDVGSGQPVPEARVTLRREDPRGTRGAGARPVADPAPSGLKAVITSSAGYFLFLDVAAGRYSLLVRALGYVDGGYLQGNPTDTRVKLIELGDGERRGDIELRVWKLASIGGSVFDELGAPAAGATVRVLRRWSASGRARLNPAGVVQTNEQGAYAVNNLIPGEYIVGIITKRATVPLSLVQRYAAAVAASPDPTRAPAMLGQLLNAGIGSASGTGFRAGDLILQTSGQLLGYATPQSSDGRVRSYAPVYFQNAPGLLASTPINLGSGDERTGVDLTLRLVSGVRVSGVVSEPDGLADDMALRLLAEESDELITDAGYETATTVSANGGRFTFLGVPPGTYVLKATRSQIVRTGPASNRMVWAKQPITVGDEDISDLTVTLRPGLRVRGRLEFAGAQAAPPPAAWAGIAIGLTPVVTGIMPRESSELVRPDGTFETGGDLPGRYYVTTMPMAPRGWTLRSIIYAGRNVADDPIELASIDAADLVVTFIDKIARVSGTISDVIGAKDAGFSVVLLPADSEGWRRGDLNPRRIRLSSASATGAFALEDVSAGQYYIVALSDGSIPSNWNTPGFLEKLVAGASKISVAEGENKTVSLRPISLRSSAR